MAKIQGTHTTPEEINERRAELMQHLKSNGLITSGAQQAGGYFANAAHLAGYSWEGVAIGMLMEEIFLLLAFLFDTPLLQEKMNYQNLPDEFKFDLDNYDPEATPIYKYSTRGGQVRLDMSRPLTQDEITPLDLVANGYMYKPDRALAYRRRWNEFNENMIGKTRDREWDTLFEVVEGKRHDTPANQSRRDLLDYQRLRPS